MIAVGASEPRRSVGSAAHATCIGIELRSVIARRGGTGRRLRVTATIAVEKGREAILVLPWQPRAEV